MIPTFPSFKPIELSDQEAMESYLNSHPPLASEYTFTNLYAWSDAYHYQLARYADGFLILKDGSLEPSFLQPLVPGDALEAVRACLDFLREKTENPIIERVGEDFAARLPEDLSGLRLNEARDQFDYVYRIDELVALCGPKFHDKKNLLNQFERNNPYQYVPLSKELIGDCLRFQHEWCVEKRCEHVEGLSQENCASHKMLMHFTRLRIFGGALLVGGKMAAYTLAEQLNPDTLVIHLEKARTGMIGAYQAINREFLAHAGSGYTYVNREQDLGISGLRKAKQSYNPACMVKKYTITTA